MGIFGRESLDLATRSTTPDIGTPTFNAMKIYRNYDGNKSTFGDISISDAINTNVDLVSSFAAVRSSDNALTVVVVNKQLAATATLTLSLANFVNSGTAQVWQLTSANSINRLSDLSVSGNSLTTIVPPQSITLFVLPSGSALPPIPPLLSQTSWSGTSFGFTMNGQTGTNYVTQYSSDLIHWTPIATNRLTGSSSNLSFKAPDTTRFYRAEVVP